MWVCVSVSVIELFCREFSCLLKAEVENQISESVSVSLFWVCVCMCVSVGLSVIELFCGEFLRLS